MYNLKSENLNGFVKTIKTYNYRPESVAKEYEERDKTDSFMMDAIIFFDRFGNAEEEIYYNSDGSIYQNRYFIYDENNYCVETGYISNGKCTFKNNFAYNKKGVGVEAINYFDDNFIEKEIFSYDSEGNCICSKSYNYLTGEYAGKSLYFYKDFNKYKEMIRYDKNDVMNQKVIFFRDERGNDLEYLHYERENTLRFKSNRKYDHSNNVIEDVFFSNYGIPNNITRLIDYEYDSQNNWIKKFVKENGIHINTVIRIIEYYS